MLKMIPMYSESNSCLENNLSTLSHWLGRESVLMHAGAWYFSFRPPYEGDYGILGTRLSAGVQKSLDSLERYHGLKLEWHGGPVREQIALAKAELETGKPVVLGIDSYWLPWNPKYQNRNAYRGNHYCLAIGWEESEQVIICLDPHVATRTELKYLPVADFIQGNARCARFSIGGGPAEEPQWQSIVKEAVETLYSPQEHGRNSFEDIHFFADEVAGKLDLEAEVKVLETGIFPKLVPLAHNLQYLAKGRANFSRILDYWGQRFPQTDLSPMAERMSGFARSWHELLQLYTQTMAVKSKSEQRRRIVESTTVIRRLAVDEARLAGELRERYLKHWTVGVGKNPPDK